MLQHLVLSVKVPLHLVKIFVVEGRSRIALLVNIEMKIVRLLLWLLEFMMAPFLCVIQMLLLGLLMLLLLPLDVMLVLLLLELLLG